MGGVFTTKRKVHKALLEFKLPEFSTNKTVEWVCHVDENTTPDKAQYDIIIGTDLMSAMGLDIHFSLKQICWEDVAIPMKQRGTITPSLLLRSIYTAWRTILRCYKPRRTDKSEFSMRTTKPSTSTTTSRRYRTSATTRRQKLRRC
jgi:hypothetical protein